MPKVAFFAMIAATLTTTVTLAPLASLPVFASTSENAGSTNTSGLVFGTTPQFTADSIVPLVCPSANQSFSFFGTTLYNTYNPTIKVQMGAYTLSYDVAEGQSIIANLQVSGGNLFPRQLTFRNNITGKDAKESIGQRMTNRVMSCGTKNNTFYSVYFGNPF